MTNMKDTYEVYFLNLRKDFKNAYKPKTWYINLTKI